MIWTSPNISIINGSVCHFKRYASDHTYANKKDKHVRIKNGCENSNPVSPWNKRKNNT